MTIIIISALIASSLLYLGVAFYFNRNTKKLSDFLPITKEGNHVKSQAEFSSSTVATTVSLATIVLAYFQLAGHFHYYLLWTVITTAIGMLLLVKYGKIIWSKMQLYRNTPSLHEFLGVEYNSKTLALFASIATTLGFLLIFATELIVGSRFLASLIPSIPEWVTVIFLSTIGFLYTLAGFRTVIVTDRIQMNMIWLLIISLGIFIGFYWSNIGIDAAILNLNNNLNPKLKVNGLGWFLLGIAVMNIPTHLSNMSIWQRIGAVKNIEDINNGFKKSTLQILLSWSSICLLAVLSFSILVPNSPNSLLSDILIIMSKTTIGKITLFGVVLGLYASMLSTASTNLIVITHTLSEDVFAKLNKTNLNERINSKKSFWFSRFLLIISTIFAVFLVEGLKQIGFSIVDLVFAIYGGALALFPPIIVALHKNRERLWSLSNYSTLSVIIGFIACWGVAIYGRNIGDSNLVFLSPVFAIITSGIILISGLILTKKR